MRQSPKFGRLKIANCKFAIYGSRLSAVLCAVLLLSGPVCAQQAQPPNRKASSPASASASEKQDVTKREGESLPKLDEMKLPTAAELLNDPPVDWIILKTDEVLVCKPVYPRPDTLAKMQARIEESFKWPRPANREEIAKQAEKRNALYYIEVFLPGDAEPYKLHMKHVAEIRHYEDLMLRRVDTLLDESSGGDGDKLSTAFELVFRLARREPDWPGLTERRDHLLFVQAQSELEKGRAETALVFVEELRDRKPGYSGLQELAGKIADRLISDAVAKDDFREARHFLNRLEKFAADHPVAQKWRDNLSDRAKRLIAQAAEASQNGAHDTAAALVDQAARVWPAATGLREAHRRLTERFQRLKVGVLRLPGEPSAYFLPTAAERRQRFLTQATLFEIDRIDETPHYRTRFFEQWEPTDLGRRTEFTLRQSRSYWESLPVVTASPVIAALTARLDPSNPLYDERFDSFIESLTVHSPFQFEVRFTRIPLRTETLFDFPLQGRLAPLPSESSPRKQGNPLLARRATDEGANNDGTADALLSQRFQIQEQTADRVVYRRTHPEPEGVGQYHVAEVVEHKYASYDRAIQGLLRGKVSFLPHLPIPDVERLRGDDRFFVQQSAVPVTHVLQFNPESKPLQNRELRRALAYAIDRPRILKIVILGGSDSPHARLVSAPFPSNSYAYGSLINLRDHDVLLAVSLAFGARKQLGGTVPTLNMIAPPEPVAQAAARDIIRQWERIGVHVELVSDTEAAGNSPPSDWDILYRTVQMAEPLTELWPFLTFDPQVRVESLRHLPDWLAQELIDLENAADWSSATRILHQLHRHLQAEAQVIPLWEVDDLLVIRKNISGFPSRPVHPYQGLERWTVQSWYPTDEP